MDMVENLSPQKIQKAIVNSDVLGCQIFQALGNRLAWLGEWPALIALSIAAIIEDDKK